jgi:hypothetical protein
MAELNFGLINQNLPGEIANSVQRGQQEAVREQAAQQQLKTGALQQENIQMQLEQAKRDRDALAKMQAAFVANGKSPDLESNFDEMIRSGISHYVDIGIQGKQKLIEQKRFASIMGGDFGAPQAPAAVPSVAAPANALAPSAAAPSVGAPINALTPSVAAPVNNLATPQSANSDVATLRRKRDMLLGMGTTQSIAAARAIDADIALASKEPVYHNVQGVGLVNPRDKSVVVPSVETDSEFEKLLKRSNLSDDQKNALRIQRAQKEATHAPGANVSVTNVSEKAEQGARGKMLVDQYATVSNAAGLAAKTLPAINSNLSILNNGFDTGFGTETKAAGAKVLAALGVKDAEKYATNAQTFLANVNSAVLQKQLEQKGTQTASDAERIEKTGAQFGNTKQANQFILSAAKAQLNRDIDQRNFYANWYKNNKTYDGAEDAWFGGEGGKSLFDRPELKQYAAPTNAAASQAPGRPSLNSIFKKN